MNQYVNTSQCAHRLATIALLGICFLLVFTSTAFATQIGDLARIKGSEQSKLVGMGLVVGLNGTGDSGKFLPAMEPLANVIRRKINAATVAGALKKVKNVALVYLEAKTASAGMRNGDQIDVYVSAIGSASSLEGGTLLMMPMTGPLPNSGIYAYASGRITLENTNLPTSGVIHGGVQMVADIPSSYIQDGKMTLVLKDHVAHFEIASNIADRINDIILDGPRIATAIDSKNIVVKIPKPELKNPVPFIAEIIGSYIDPDLITTGAHVRINERTGTIAISGDVQISPVIIQQSGLSITLVSPKRKATANNPLVQEYTSIALDPGKRGGTHLSELVAAFNQLKVSIKDRIAIIKEIHRMGKLHAKLTFD